MNIQDIISRAIPLAESHAQPLVSELQKVQALIAGDTLKVAVLGKFKAGKSTLLNRVFLKSGVLPVAEAEATAVPTYLTNGEKRMQVWLRGEDGQDSLECEKTDFTPEDVAKAVTSASADARAKMAEKYSKVVVSMPGILPEGITVVDTPGLDTTNTQILIGTLQEARQADAVLYVVRSKQLDENEVEYIRMLAGSQVAKLPIHIIFTDTKSEITGGMEEVRREIKAQLADFGVECGVSFFLLNGQMSDKKLKIDTEIDLDDSWGGYTWGTDSDLPVEESVPVALPEERHVDTVASEDDSWGFDWGDDVTSQPEEQPEVVSAENNGDIYDELIEFLNGEACRGREARICRELVPVIFKLRMAMESRLQVAETSEEDIVKLQARAEKQQQEYLRAMEEMKMDVKKAQLRFKEGVSALLDEMTESSVNVVQGFDDINDIRNYLNKWAEKLPFNINRILQQAQEDMLVNMQVIGKKYEQNLAGIMLKSVSEEDAKAEFGFMLNLARKIPGILVIMTDYLICDLLTGGLWGFVARFIATFIPVIKDFMPEVIYARMLKRSAESCIRENMGNIKIRLSEKLDQSFEEMNARLSQEIADVDVYEQLKLATQDARQGLLTEKDKGELESQLQEVRVWVNAL